MRLENNFLSVELTTVGAELTRIYDKETKTEVLWNGDAKYWSRHSPLLFPHIGRSWQGSVNIAGTQYPADKHGFAKTAEFECVKATEDGVVLMMHSSEETKEVYPFDFVMYVEYQLNGKELSVTWKVNNLSDETMHFAVGGHPAFAFAKEGEVKTDYCLKFPGKEKLEHMLVDLASGTMLTEEVRTMELENACHPLNEEMFAIDTFVYDGGQVEEGWLCKKDGTPYVGVRCPGFSTFAVWSPKDAPFVCLEPWSGRCDDYGFEGDISERPSVNALKAGEWFEKSYQIIIA